MARSYIRQDTQVRPSDVYDDTFAMANAETAATNIEEDLNYLRTQEKVITGMPNWFDPPEDSFNLKAIHDKLFTYWVQKTDDVTIGSGENFVSLTGATKPSGNIAIATGALGVITSQLSGAIGSHDLAMKTDRSNVLEIRDADTNLAIYTAEIGGREMQIFGLLQVGSDATDGNAFGDTSSDDQAQISFVYFDPATEAVTACPISAIEGKVIEYAYRVRTDFYNLPENAFDQQITFVDSFSSGLDDLQDAYDNGDGSIFLTVSKDLLIELNDGNANFVIQNDGSDVFKTDFSTSQMISNYNMLLENQTELRLAEAIANGTNVTGFKAPASLAADVVYTMPATDGTANQALVTNGSKVLSWANLDSASAKMALVKTTNGDIPANTSIDITDSVNFTIINPDSIDMGSVAASWAKNYDVYLNGELMLSDVAGSDDVYYVDSTHIKFTFLIKKNDIITIIRRKVS
jgi:hypothetical protein